MFDNVKNFMQFSATFFLGLNLCAVLNGRWCVGAIEPQVRTLLFWNFFLLCKEKSA